MAHPYRQTATGARERVADARLGWAPQRIDMTSPDAAVRAAEARAYLRTLAAELRNWTEEVEIAAGIVDEIARYAPRGEAA